MIERTDLLLKYINEFIINNNLNYKKQGYIISICENYINILYNNNEYKLLIVEDDSELFWLLKPYESSYFMTLINNSINSFNLVLAAIKDNEKKKQ